ncbi:hypothetical protein BS47DRAFT_845063 [Hydnum rufescens UP504]|uniref:Uncharacterized protein n=1 Tax=Hydnum rufescens UP504 TaxID=1448309 RepID=A0A9P6DG79_9AGAM|nr:hypothetical protein BS47DRAFT_845063 [Hydnum rufescens UP504]
MQNLEPSLPPTSSDPAGTGPRVFGGDGVDTGLESRSDDGGTPESSTFGLAPETREDETIVQNLEPSLPPPPVIRLRPGPGYLGMISPHLDIAVYGIAQGRLEIELYPTPPTTSHHTLWACVRVLLESVILHRVFRCHPRCGTLGGGHSVE